MRRLGFILTLLSLPLAAQTPYGRLNFQLQNAQGQAISGATVYVYAQSACGVAADMTSPAAIYSAATGGVLSQPVITDGFGTGSAYAPQGCYTVVYYSPYTGTITLVDQNSVAATNLIPPGGPFVPLAGGTMTGALNGPNAAFTSTVAAATTLPLPYTTCTAWGDSLTCGVGAGIGSCSIYTLGTNTFPALLQALAPSCTVLNRGIPSQTSSDVLIRMGMCPNGGPSYLPGSCVATLTSPLGTSAGSTATFTVPNGVLGYRACAFSTVVGIPVVINGIPGTCVDTSGTGLGTYTFTSTGASAGLSTGTYNYNGNPPASELAGLNIIWVGTNNVFRPPTIVADVDTIVTGLPNGSDYVILDPLNQNSLDGWAGNKDNNTTRAIGASEWQHYPAHTLLVREALVNLGKNYITGMQQTDFIHDVTPYTYRGLYSPGTLVADITDTTSCTFTVSGTPTPLTGYVVQFDSEYIYVVTPGSVCIRGYGNSTAATHTAGATATEYDAVHLKDGYGNVAGWTYAWMQADAGATSSYLTPAQKLQNYKIATTNAQPVDYPSRYAFALNGFGDTPTYKAGNNAAHGQYSGTNWTAVGAFAGYSNVSGNGWTALGKSAAFFNASASDWMAIGLFAGEHALGSNWLAIGSQAALVATGGNFHAVGYEAGFKHTSGDGFFAEGSTALFNNLNCARCYASGTANSFTNANGDNFTDVGYQGAYNNNGPGPYTGLGTFNGYNSSTGYDWTCVGTSCGYFNMTGSGWTALGRSAGINTDVGGSGTGSWVGAVNPVTIAVTSGAAPTLGAILTGVGIPANDVVTAVSGAGPYSVTLTAASTVSPVGVYSWSVGGGGAGTSSFTVGVNPVTITVTSGAAPQVNGILVGTNIPANDMITTVSGGGPYTVTLTTAPTGSASGTYNWNGVHSSEWTAVGHLAGANNASGDFWTGVGSNSLLYANTSYNVGIGYNAGTVILDGTTHNVTSANSVYIGANTRAKSDGCTNETVIGYGAIGNCTNTATIGDVTTTDVYLGQNGGATLHAVVANTTSTLFSYVGTTDTVACPNNTTANFATTYSIPANTIKAGTQLRLTFAFSMTATATVPTFSFRMTIGGTSVFVAQPTAPAAVSGNPMSVGATFLIGGTAAASASSAVLTNIIQTATGANSNFSPFSQSAAATANPQQNLATNGSLTIQPILFCGANTAGNSLTLNQMLVEQVHQ